MKLEKIKHDTLQFNFSKIVEIFILRFTVKHIPPNNIKLKLICKRDTYTSREDIVFDSFGFWKKQCKIVSNFKDI